MNHLDQLGTRISLIDSAFDQWIKQQNLNYNSFGEKRAARLSADLDVLAELMTQAIHTKQGRGS